MWFSGGEVNGVTDFRGFGRDVTRLFVRQNLFDKVEPDIGCHSHVQRFAAEVRLAMIMWPRNASLTYYESGNAVRL